MAFMVRDLMFNVLPDADANANARELQLCQFASPGQQPPPEKPKKPPQKPPQPAPKPQPECTFQSQTGASQFEAAAELASLPVLREQLRQALHA